MSDTLLFPTVILKSFARHSRRLSYVKQAEMFEGKDEKLISEQQARDTAEED